MPSSYRHGGRKLPEYEIWNGMIQRCDNSNRQSYVYYGARGISVCPEWYDFPAFYAAVGPRPEGMSLDRIDPDGNYEPGNVRWATPSEQRRNRRDYRAVNG